MDSFRLAASAFLVLAALVSTAPAAEETFEYSGCETVGDIKMYYEIHGESKPLLLIMGLGGHILDWGWVLPEKLAEGRQVILFDNRGSGRSDQPEGPYSIMQMANDTASLMDAIGIERADIFGVSMGGMIAQQMALDYPHHVDKLILGSTSAGGDLQVLTPPEIQAYLEPRLDLTPHEALWWTAPAGFPQEFIEANPKIIERKIQANLAYPSELHAYEAQLAAYKSHDVYARLSSIQSPTLVLTGDADVLIPPENSHMLEKNIPDAQLREIKGAGHLFWISHPNETFSALVDFLDEEDSTCS